MFTRLQPIVYIIAIIHETITLMSGDNLSVSYCGACSLEVVKHEAEALDAGTNDAKVYYVMRVSLCSSEGAHRTAYQVMQPCEIKVSDGMGCALRSSPTCQIDRV